MRKYKVIEVSEKQLEDMVRKAPDSIEEGLRYVDHQKRTDRGPLDILLVDSGNALIVAELKIAEDDGMLVQGIDYYDYVSANVEAFARACKDKDIDPKQEPWLFLIAPSFSVSLLNRCKWVNIQIRLFTFQCIEIENHPKDPIVVFNEVKVPSTPEPPEVYTTIDEKLNYITDEAVREIAAGLLREVKTWDEENVSADSLKNDISIKVSGRVFSYVSTRRKYFFVSTFDRENKWTSFRIQQVEDLEEVKDLLRTNYEYFRDKARS